MRHREREREKKGKWVRSVKRKREREEWVSLFSLSLCFLSPNSSLAARTRGRWEMVPAFMGQWVGFACCFALLCIAIAKCEAQQMPPVACLNYNVDPAGKMGIGKSEVFRVLNPLGSYTVTQ